MKLNKNTTKLFLVAPANTATGGPFLLHQLASKLIEMGFDAKMLYIKHSEIEDPVHAFYKHFQIPYTYELEDVAENLVIFPEVYTEMIFRYKQIQKVIWWLSVDNFLDANAQKLPFSLKRFLGLKPPVHHYRFQETPPHQHWVQCYYAKHFLESKGVSNIKDLSDYLDPIFINELKNRSFNNQNKKEIVAYNPKKGYEVTQELIKKAPHIQWVPIENMTPEQVKELLISAKIYIDFGHHPGKDRIPREAAMCGCIVITNRKGSAAFTEDVPIPEKFKIDYIPGQEESIIRLLENSFSNYENELLLFEPYKAKIENEEAVFNADLNKIIATFFD